MTVNLVDTGVKCRAVPTQNLLKVGIYEKTKATNISRPLLHPALWVAQEVTEITKLKLQALIGEGRARILNVAQLCPRVER